MATKKTAKPVNQPDIEHDYPLGQDGDIFDIFQDPELKVYVDTPLRMQIGAFTSKIAFGSEDQDELTPAELVLTIPTNKLLHLANGIFSILGQPEVRSGVSSQMKEFLLDLKKVPIVEFEPSPAKK